MSVFIRDLSLMKRDIIRSAIRDSDLIKNGPDEQRHHQVRIPDEKRHHQGTSGPRTCYQVRIPDGVPGYTAGQVLYVAKDTHTILILRI